MACFMTFAAHAIDCLTEVASGRAVSIAAAGLVRAFTLCHTPRPRPAGRDDVSSPDVLVFSPAYFAQISLRRG